ncbi:hypothetical protein EBT16_12340 [bacterium]|nr:hypothetical protein [bacterium]
MLKFGRGYFLLLVSLFLSQLSSAGSDWYSYYVQCIATSSQEAQCFEAIREFLSTEEGQKQALEIGFKRRLNQDSNQVASQAVVISNRLQQMETYLFSALEQAKEDTVRTYCLSDKHLQISTLKRSVEERKGQLLQNVNRVSPGALEGDYQALLSLNSRANEIYLQARKCMK